MYEGLQGRAHRPKRSGTQQEKGQERGRNTAGRIFLRRSPAMIDRANESPRADDRDRRRKRVVLSGFGVPRKLPPKSRKRAYLAGVTETHHCSGPTRRIERHLIGQRQLRRQELEGSQMNFEGGEASPVRHAGVQRGRGASRLGSRLRGGAPLV